MDKSNHKLSSSINRLRGRKLAPFHIWVLSVVSLLALFTLFIINPDYAGKARSGRLNAAYIENRLPVALNGEWNIMTAASCFPPTFPHPARNIIRPNTGSFREPFRIPSAMAPTGLPSPSSAPPTCIPCALPEYREPRASMWMEGFCRILDLLLP